MHLSSLRSAIGQSQAQVIIFDLDGTLYNLKKLHFLMALWLLSYYLLRPWRARELYQLHQYRHWRNHLGVVDFDHDDQLYQQFAQSHNLSWTKLKDLFEYWFLVKPLSLLPLCRSNSITELLDWCRSEHLLLAVCSDYTPESKLLALDYHFDYVLYSLTNGGLKPRPDSLLRIADYFQVTPQSCLVIGDSLSTDALAAQAAGMQFINIKAYR